MCPLLIASVSSVSIHLGRKQPLTWQPFSKDLLIFWEWTLCSSSFWSHDPRSSCCTHSLAVQHPPELQDARLLDSREKSTPRVRFAPGKGQNEAAGDGPAPRRGPGRSTLPRAPWGLWGLRGELGPTSEEIGPEGPGPAPEGWVLHLDGTRKLKGGRRGGRIRCRNRGQGGRGWKSKDWETDGKAGICPGVGQPPCRPGLEPWE